jgi:hypothetical protein
MDGIATEKKTLIALVSASLSEHCSIEENAQRTAKLADFFKNNLTDSWKVAPVKGCYKGQEKDSFKVNVNDPIDLGAVDAAARHFEQESYLVIDSDRIAWLCYLKGRTVRLGEFVVVSEFEAKAQDAWTFDPESETYFIVK